MKKLGISLKFMDPFFEKIGKLSTSQRILTCCGVFFVLIGAFTWFFYLPKFSKIDQLKIEKQRLEQELVSVKRKAKLLKKYQKEFKASEAKFKLVMKALPDKKEIPSLLTNISRSGQDAGLEFLLFQPQAEIDKDFYTEIPVLIHVTGNYHNVAVFFDKLSRLNRIVNIKDIKMKTPGTGEKLDTSCTAVTYKFLERSSKPSKGKKKR